MQVLKQLKGDKTRLLVLVLDILVSLTFSICSRSASEKNECHPNGTNLTAPEAYVSVVIFAFGAVAYLAGVAYFVIIVHQCCTCKMMNNILITVGGLLFYIGDNLPPLITKYENEFSAACDSGCVERVQIAGIFCLGIATVTYLPVFIDSGIPHQEEGVTSGSAETREDINNERTALVVTLLLLAKTTNLDLVYTAISRAASYSCNENVKLGAWAYFGVYILAFAMSCIYGFAVSTSRCGASTPDGASEVDRGSTQGGASEPSEPSEPSTLDHSDPTSVPNEVQDRRTRVLFAFVAVFIITLFAASFILADTKLPLACTGDAEKNSCTQDGVRLFLWFATCIFAGVGLAWSYCYEKWYVRVKLLCVYWEIANCM